MSGAKTTISSYVRTVPPFPWSTSPHHGHRAAVQATRGWSGKASQDEPHGPQRMAVYATRMGAVNATFLTLSVFYDSDTR